MMMKNAALLATLGLAIAGCATHGAMRSQSTADTITSAQQAVARAQKEHLDLWISTAKYVKEAEKLNRAGKSARARKLAQTAIEQVDLAEAQAKSQAGAGPYYKR